MFIHMFIVNVQSCLVHNACYFWIRCSLSNHVFCQPCRHFRVDIFSVISMIFFTRTFDPAWVNITITLLCINHQLKCCNPAVVIFSLHRRFRRCDFEALAHCSCPDSHFSTYAFWHDSLLPVSRHLLTIDLTRATHCPVIAPVVNTVIILTIDRASSSGRHTRQRHMPVDRQQRHPVHYLRRLFSPDFTERRITSKDSEHHHRVEHHSRRPRVLPAPHHRLLVSALFTASLAPSTSTSYASLHQPR